MFQYCCQLIGGTSHLGCHSGPNLIKLFTLVIYKCNLQNKVVISKVFINVHNELLFLSGRPF
jgi:hypothetical protein